MTAWRACTAPRARPAWRGLRALALAWLLAAGAALAVPARHALLVGVSELPGQPPANWLLAPANDVRLMRDSLLGQGWSPSSIEVLADGVAGAPAPALDSIRAALGRLVTSVAPGDFVLLYFSGHGTRLRDPGKSYQEPDSLSEMFLAPGGALRDEEIGRWVQALLARGSFVWSVFDTCSAASMTRGGVPAAAAVEPDDPVRFRGLASTELAAPVRAAALGVDAASVPRSDDPPVPPARYVAFFASESHQVTPELRLPRRQGVAEMHGLLTWAIADALQGRPATWRALFEQVLARYPAIIDELEQRFPTRELPSPVAEGALDVPLWRNTAAAASTQPIWPAHRDGADLVVAAGLLDGLLPGQALRVSALDAEGRLHVADAVAARPAPGSTRLPLPAAWRAAPPAASWQVAPIEPPASLALRVLAEGAAARQALDGINLEYPASLRVVDGGPADVRVRGTATRFTLRLAGQEPQAIDGVDALRRRLAGLATQRWLGRLAHLAQPLTPLAGFEAWLWPQGGPEASAQPEPLAQEVQRPLAGSALEVANASGQSVDLMIVGVAGDGAVWPIFPAALGESNRFERGDAALPARKRFTLPAELAQPGGTLLVLATPARPRSLPRLFGLAPPASGAAGDVLLRAAGAPADQAYAVLAQW
ncbi:MAG TPA: caspase family protein [Ottowia sp.]|uniref:caspase family protein n=1 Tax=Ottowia sp. TaxID=1898956 RepID=UPI002B7F8CAB|nr:caspase family protein [Ottowia sp.]HMN20129.1 caspase family protein [Ottowia sp.]